MNSREAKSRTLAQLDDRTAGMALTGSSAISNSSSPSAERCSRSRGLLYYGLFEVEKRM